jgi:hypothetical protein
MWSRLAGTWCLHLSSDTQSCRNLILSLPATRAAVALRHANVRQPDATPTLACSRRAHILGAGQSVSEWCVRLTRGGAVASVQVGVDCLAGTVDERVVVVQDGCDA